MKRVRSRLPALGPPLKGHLERDLDRGRAAVGVEDAVQAPGRDRHQALGELDRRRVREAEHRRVRDPVELVADRRVDRRVAVAVDVAPQRGDAVDVGVAVGVEQVVPSARAIDQRRLRPRHQPCCWVNGCQTWRRSAAIRSRWSACLSSYAAGRSENGGPWRRRRGRRSGQPAVQRQCAAAAARAPGSGPRPCPASPPRPRRAARSSRGWRLDPVRRGRPRREHDAADVSPAARAASRVSSVWLIVPRPGARRPPAAGRSARRGRARQSSGPSGTSRPPTPSTISADRRRPRGAAAR